MAVLRWVWVLVWSVPGCKGHTYRLPTVCTVNTELAGLVVRLSKFTISPPILRDLVTREVVSVEHISGVVMLADILTKAASRGVFVDLIKQLDSFA